MSKRGGQRRSPVVTWALIRKGLTWVVRPGTRGKLTCDRAQSVSTRKRLRGRIHDEAVRKKGTVDVRGSVRDSIYKLEELFGGTVAPLRWGDQSVPLEGRILLGGQIPTWVRKKVWT
jgi:hypothetical protein